MKNIIISAQGLMLGKVHDETVVTAFNERVSKKLLGLYKRYSNGEEITFTPQFSYKLFMGIVTSMELGFKVLSDNSEQIETFCHVCRLFFNIDKFSVNVSDEEGDVSAYADNFIDIAYLMHAIETAGVSLDNLFAIADENMTEKDEVYSLHGSTIVQIPDQYHYRIKEGTQRIAPFALQQCSKLRELDIPAGLMDYQNVINGYRYSLKTKVWDKHYDGSSCDEPVGDEDEFVLDDYHVAYTEDKKVLLFCQSDFAESEYHVPDGVEYIADYAFLMCMHYVVLFVPDSIKEIGCSIFGNGGGRIVFRDKTLL